MTTTGGDPTPASITIHRPLDWMDTDAAGIWHWTTTFRHLEAAEHALHEQLEIVAHTFGHTPRVRVEVDFTAPVRFGEVITSTLRVTDVGRSSIRYTFELAVGERTVAGGTLVTVVTGPDGRATAVPDEVRRPLLEAGVVSAQAQDTARGPV